MIIPRGTLVALATFVVAALVVAAPLGATTILFLGNDAGPTFGADGAVMAHLQARYGAGNVSYLQGTASTTADAMGKDAVIISATLNSGDVRDKFEDVTAGVMNWEQALMTTTVGNFQMSTSGGTTDSQTQINIVDPVHPLAGGLNGTVTVTNTGQTFSHGGAPLGAGVALVAELTSDPAGKKGIFAADVGGALLGDDSAGRPSTAPGRRVSFFLQDATFGDLTPDGITLFDAAVDWTANVSVIPEPSSVVLMVSGAAGLGLLGLRRRRRARPA